MEAELRPWGTADAAGVWSVQVLVLTAAGLRNRWAWEGKRAAVRKEDSRNTPAQS